MRNCFRLGPLVMAVAALLAVNDEARAGVARSVARGAERAAVRAVRPVVAPVARKAVFRSPGRAAARRGATPAVRAAILDRARDARTPVSLLRRPRLVFRYSDDAGVRRAITRGLPARTHFTARGGPGRPLGGQAARERLGLARTPSWRISTLLPRGTPVRFNKVLGGNRAGVGEISLARRLPASSIRRAVPLVKPRSPLGARLLEGLRKKGAD